MRVMAEHQVCALINCKMRNFLHLTADRILMLNTAVNADDDRIRILLSQLGNPLGDQFLRLIISPQLGN